MKKSVTHVARVCGERACFSDVNLNVEKLSYDVPTVSAMRQILGCVYAKPEMRIVIERIEVLNPIKKHTMFVNGVNKFFDGSMIKGSASVVSDFRLQYMITHLVDVDYRVFFRIEDEGHDRQDGWRAGKHDQIYAERLKRGALYKTPFLGLKEFIATVRPDYDDKQPITDSKDMGGMLFDMIHPTKYNRLKQVQRSFRHIVMQNGVITFQD